MNHTCDSLFAEYHYMLIDFQEDTLTWKELDSVQVQKLIVLSQVPSSVQNFALAARALRGDTTYYRHPASGIEYELRFAEKPEKSKNAHDEPSFELFPNPNDGTFSLTVASEQGVYRYHVIDITGREIVSSQFSKDNGKQLVSLSVNLRKGIYLFGLYKPDGTLGGYKRMVVAK